MPTQASNKKYWWIASVFVPIIIAIIAARPEIISNIGTMLKIKYNSQFVKKIDANIAINKHTSASRSALGAGPNYAVDGNIATAWNTEADEPQQIDIELGGSFDISGIELIVEQTPQGNTIHQVLAKKELQQYQLVKTFEGFTKDGDYLIHKFQPALQNIKSIRVITIQSPSWIAWNEIIILGQQHKD